MPDTLAIEVAGLACVRGERLLFRDLSFDVAKGQVLAVEGPNGSGKTSLLRLLAGFLAPAAGSVAIHANAASASEAEERGKLVAWIGHQDAAKSQLTPREALTFHASFYRTHADIGAVLARVGLSQLADLRCQYLSAGQKKRVALARLLLSGRAVWLLDEPLASLDAGGKRLAAELISEHVGHSGTVVMATHEPLGIPCERLGLGVGT